MIIDKVSTFPPGLLVKAILGMEQVPLRHPAHGDGGRHPARSDGGRGQQPDPPARSGLGRPPTIHLWVWG